MDIINPKGLKTERISTEWCGRELTLEVNRVGFRTTSSVVVSYGDTTILGSVVVSKKPVEQDFFPLSIEYEEKFYAAGKMSGSKFIKREGKPSDNAVLVGRLIDRPIRPLFPKGYRQEVQVVATVLSMDPNFRPDCVAMVAASAALHCAGIPFDGPVAGVRIGKVDGKFKAFLTPEEREASDLDLVVAVRDGKVMMVEAGANEVPEEEIIEAMKWACENCKPALELQNKLREIVKPEELPYELTLPEESIQERVDKWCEPHFAGGKIRGNVLERQKICDELRDEMDAELALELGEGENDEEKIADYEARLKKEYDEAFELAVHHEVRRGIVEEGVRPDGRKLTEVRPLSSQVSVLPRVHGSSLFTRGLTQAMNIVTLAPMSFAQVVDTMEVTDGIRRYIHHYNAAPFTVGEIGRIGSPGRREIGHGYLAERALMPVLPSVEDFPYAIRSVTEIMSQNGSTSMAATCSSCLALMDAGVPLKRPVSGVAMGLMVDVPKGHDITAADIDKAYVLTDLMDAEDFAGDMDFKVTGTTKGVTALQMDMKVHGLPVEILEKAIAQSHEGRMFILDHMLSVLPGPREHISEYAPRIEKLKINPDKIGAVIGKGGEMINKITSETGATVDIEDDGLVTIAGTNAESIQKALDWVKSLTEEPEVGKIYTGKVVTIKDFGAFVNILPGIDGMLHISQISDKRLKTVDEVLHVGDTVKVKLVAIDDKGKLSLSMKSVQQ
ncbi:polyribonucleotide nucleotidyltransferase [Candidatus Saccharibacteria bacterium]|nr:polyribonucleotide nucleotidyltransferase [Candidatus Saccharibacteria bacterium]MBR0415709.1 polyribonucleotide nucleotidyltransferase [Candidatus Saccharibacteria bacterium]